MGNKITYHSPSRGCSMEMGAAVTVLVFSQFSLPVGGGLNQSGTSSYGDSFAPQQQQQQQGAFDNSGMYNTQPGFVDYNFSFGGAQVYNSGAIELDHMCVPSPLQMETIAEYGTYP